MAAHSSTPAWRIPWTEEPGGLQTVWSQRVKRAGHDLASKPPGQGTRSHMPQLKDHACHNQDSDYFSDLFPL